jgi:hypothetical protein
MSSEKGSTWLVSVVQKMKHAWPGVLLLMLLALACRALPANAPPVATATAHPSATLVPSSTASRPPATRTPSPAASPTASLPPASLTSTATPPFRLQLHPEGGLYVGDQVSFEIIGDTPSDTQASITIEGVADLGSASFKPFGIDGRNQATFLWAWDTSGLPPATYTATLTVGAETWQQPITLQDAARLDEGEWASLATACCVIHYITHTEAERDLPTLAAEADSQARRAAQRLGISFTEPITITLLARVLGHGGFASDAGIAISYLDQNYANNRFDIVLHHEMIHILDARLAGDYRPSLFVEGLAVYLTGGHFKEEPLLERAAALLAIEGGEWYIPLAALANDFYPSQHEIGYLEAGALIEYMINRWGWDEFFAFYRNIQPTQDKLPATAIDAALKAHFDLSFGDLENDFLRVLRQQRVSQAAKDDLRLTVIYYDTLRRYQQLLDPSAYFATAWLLDVDEMRRRGIVADYVRHPQAEINQEVEARLIAANHALAAGDFASAESLLTQVHDRLDDFVSGLKSP